MVRVGLKGITMEHVQDSWSGAYFFVVKNNSLSFPFAGQSAKYLTNKTRIKRVLW